VVIVMLNLLIAIVSRVFDQCQSNFETEFLKAKAQLICEMETAFLLDKTNQVWFPRKIYYITKTVSASHRGSGGSTLQSHGNSPYYHQWGGRGSDGGGGGGGGTDMMAKVTDEIVRLTALQEASNERVDGVTHRQEDMEGQLQQVITLLMHIRAQLKAGGGGGGGGGDCEVSSGGGSGDVCSSGTVFHYVQLVTSSMLPTTYPHQLCLQ